MAPVITRIKECFRVGGALRAPLLLVAIYTMWITSPQFRELYYSFAERAAMAGKPGDITVVFISIWFLTLVFGIMGCILTWTADKGWEERWSYYWIIWMVLSAYVAAIFIIVTFDIARQFGWPNADASGA